MRRWRSCPREKDSVAIHIMSDTTAMRRSIRTVDDVLGMLDKLFAPDAHPGTAGASSWWDSFYADRGKPVPFFAAKPDENLVSYLDRGVLARGRVLDLGCGPGRNAIYLASRGFDVDAVDISRAALAWAEDRAREADVRVRFHCADIFSIQLPPGRYDLAYDSGCLHHLPPHRRVSYLSLLDRVLVPGGYFALACFAAGAMGSELTDEELYREGSLQGGLAFSPEELRWLFSDLTEIEMRPMAEQPAASAVFGVPFLLTALFRRP
jgi:SAM-dependent methyltransferase